MKPKILLVGNFLSSGKANPTFAELLANHLESAGYSIVTTSHWHFRPLRLIDMLFSTWFHRKEYRVVYIALFSGLAFFWAEVVCWLLSLIRKPYILTLHGGNLPVFAQQWPNRVTRLIRGAVKVISPSEFLLEKMRLYRNDIQIIPSPIDIRLYPFRLRSRPAQRLVWLRAFHNIYNPQIAPLVVAELQKSFPNITLTMVGPDKGDGALQETKKRINQLGLQQSIEIITGVPKSQVPEMLERGDIFINTTNVDNTPISIIEAMACGLCVVSTNVGGISYLLSDEKDALLVPPNNPQSLASAVERLLSEPTLAEKLSKNARFKAELFDWSVVFPQWEVMFNEFVIK